MTSDFNIGDLVTILNEPEALGIVTYKDTEQIIVHWIDKSEWLTHNNRSYRNNVQQRILIRL